MLGLIQWALHTADTWCGEIGLSVNPVKTELVFTWKRNLPGFFESLFSGVTLHRSKVGQVSQGSPGFLADLKKACEYQGSQYNVGL